ncbi:MAG: hypothetical protein IIX05_01450 [Selenomonadaceae bacterium]|nr:hypothetical protein [Selenomonadaceae bacterium]
MFDVLEMIADCTSAGLARSGEIREITIDKDVLYFVPKSDEFCHTLYVARTHSTDKNPIVHAYIQAAKDVYNALPQL